MDSSRNNDRSLFLGVISALGIAAVTGVIGWTFAHVVEMSTIIEHTATLQQSMAEHAAQQDKWIEELNKKLEAAQNETRTAIGNTRDLLTTVLSRLDRPTDGKSSR